MNQHQLTPEATISFGDLDDARFDAQLDQARIIAYEYTDGERCLGIILKADDEAGELVGRLSRLNMEASAQLTQTLQVRDMAEGVVAYFPGVTATGYDGDAEAEAQRYTEIHESGSDLAEADWS